MEPWSINLQGTKGQILEALPGSGMPAGAQQAVTALLEMHAEVPGWADAEPHALWLADCKAHPELHRFGEEGPPLRAEVWDSKWRVISTGDIEGCVPIHIAIEAVRITK
jgi:hypothetical protein